MMSNELQKQVTIEEAISEGSRGQTSDRQDLVDRMYKLIASHPTPYDYAINEKLTSLEEFFTEREYWFLLSQCYEGKMPTCYGHGYRRYAVLGNHIYSRYYSVQIYFDGDEFIFSFYSMRSRSISVEDYMDKGFEYVRNLVLEVAELKLSSYGQIVPGDTSEIFDRCIYKIGEDLNGITQNSLDLIMRVGDLKNFGSDYFRLYGCHTMNEFLSQQFNLSSTTVKNMLSVYDKFFEHAHLKMGYADYSYSQLVELCSVDSKDLDKFDESMSVREIKAKKKELAQAASSKSDDSLDDSPVVGNVQASDEVVSVSSGETVVEADSEAGCDDVPANGHVLSFQAAIDAVKEMQNPYYVPGKEKQSARYDAYANALHDVLEKLDEILTASLKCAVVPERHDNVVLLHGVLLNNSEA